MTTITPEMQALFDSVSKPKFWRPTGIGIVAEYSVLLSNASVADRKLAWKVSQHPLAKRYQHLKLQTLGRWEPRDFNWADALNWAMPTTQMARALTAEPAEEGTK